MAERSPQQRVRAALGPDLAVCVQAPGRMNVIGGHTDYVGGLALPAAIDRQVVVGLAPGTASAELHSLDAHQQVRVAWDRAWTPADWPAAAPGWSRYMVGAIAVFVAHVAGGPVPPRGVMRPVRAAVSGDVPQGAGLSSSAALVVAWLHALSRWSGVPLDDATTIDLARRVEHRWLGVPCGALDQTASQLGRADHFLRVDFRTGAVEAVASGLSSCGWLVLHSGVERTLAQSAYAERVAEVQRGLRRVQRLDPSVGHWRDLTPAHIDRVERSDPRSGRRLRHGLTENARVEAMVEAIEAGDAEAAGALLSASHQSLRDDYAVSCPELEALVACCAETDGIYGARLVGAGFGGCVLALADDGLSAVEVDAMVARYAARSGRAGRGWRVRPGPGAGDCARLSAGSP